ncbi:MAG: ion channel [Actinomycetota bacterium]|jgi:voltage-gated potassium channel|nr:ion channel [Actinomycetota bacterium]
MVTILSVLLSHVRRSQALRLALIGSACVFVGAALFGVTQRIGYWTALYWAITTATTVGYGDVTPKNASGRAVAIGVMLTTIPLFASAFAMFASTVVTANLRRLMGAMHPEPTERHVVMFGDSAALPPVAAELVAAGRKVVVVTPAERSAFPESVDVVSADPTHEEAVRRAHPERAGQVLVACKNDADVLVTAVFVRRIAPATPVLAVAGSASVSRALQDLGVEATLSADDLLVHTLTKVMEVPHAGELLLRLVDSEDYQLKELPVEAGQVGRSLSEVRAGREGLVLGVVHGNQVTVGVAEEVTLESEDCLLVLEAGSKEAGKAKAG